MADAVKEDAPPTPVVVGIFCPPAEVADPAGVTEAVEEFWLLGWRRHGNFRRVARILGFAQIPSPQQASSMSVA